MSILHGCKSNFCATGALSLFPCNKCQALWLTLGPEIFSEMALEEPHLVYLAIPRLATSPRVPTSLDQMNQEQLES